MTAPRKQFAFLGRKTNRSKSERFAKLVARHFGKDFVSDLPPRAEICYIQVGADTCAEEAL
jgi:hypothetical protein